MVTNAILTERYDELANTWDDIIIRLGYDKAYENLFDALQCRKSRLDLNHTSKVLDVGIGSGSLSAALIKSFQFEGELSGIDISKSMLQQTQVNLKHLGHKRLMLKQASIEKLPFPDNYFDFVITAHVLEHCSIALAITELLRVLKPKAYLLVITTRPGLWGQWIKWKWGIRLRSKSYLQKWFYVLGVQQMEELAFGKNSWIQWMSTAQLVQSNSKDFLVL